MGLAEGRRRGALAAPKTRRARRLSKQGQRQANATYALRDAFLHAEVEREERQRLKASGLPYGVPAENEPALEPRPPNLVQASPMHEAAARTC